MTEISTEMWGSRSLSLTTLPLYEKLTTSLVAPVYDMVKGHCVCK